MDTLFGHNIFGASTFPLWRVAVYANSQHMAQNRASFERGGGGGLWGEGGGGVWPAPPQPLIFAHDNVSQQFFPFWCWVFVVKKDDSFLEGC